MSLSALVDFRQVFILGIVPISLGTSVHNVILVYDAEKSQIPAFVIECVGKRCACVLSMVA